MYINLKVLLIIHIFVAVIKSLQLNMQMQFNAVECKFWAIGKNGMQSFVRSVFISNLMRRRRRPNGGIFYR